MESLLHPDIFLSLTPSFFLLMRANRSPGSHLGEHIVLEAQVKVAHTLEHTAQLEGPGDGLLAAEEVAHLHGITNEPCRENGDPEALARAGAVVGQNLGNGEGSLNGETNAAEDADISIRFGDRGEVDHGQDGYKIGQEHPVSVGTMS